MENHFYKDKVCVVTGASSDVGLEVIRLLLKEEAIVYALDEKPVKEFGAIYVNCCFTDKESIDDAFLNVPDKIDSFFGINQISGENNDYYTTFINNFISNKYITDTYLKTRMDENSSIAFVSSTAGKYWDKYMIEYRNFMRTNNWDKMVEILCKKANPDTQGIMAFPLSMRALNYYVSEQAIELKKKHIRVNALLPTAMDKYLEKDFDNAGYEFKELVSGGIADPIDIANPIVLLNNGILSKHINGTLLVVDNGNEAEIKLGLKKDSFDTKVGIKSYKLNNKSKNDDYITQATYEYDTDGIEIL